MEQLDLRNVNIVDIEWLFAKDNEQYAALDIDGELVFSVSPLVSVSCGEWCDEYDELARKTNFFPLGKYEDHFPNWDELVYTRTHIKYKDNIYEINKPIEDSMGAMFNSDVINETIQIFENDSNEVKIGKLLEMQDSIEKVIDALRLESPKTQPDWSKAPDWANWWAVDSEDGDAWFFAEEPMLSVVHVQEREGNPFVIYWDSCGYSDTPQNRMEFDNDTYHYYKEHNFHRSLTKRPE
jgi:hypothetical protein